jgi:hypothetical protein
MRKFDVLIRDDLDDLKSARLQAAGMPVAPAAGRKPASEAERMTTIVRVAAQSESMARAQVAAVLGTDGGELRAYPAPA